MICMAARVGFEWLYYVTPFVVWSVLLFAFLFLCDAFATAVFFIAKRRARK